MLQLRARYTYSSTGKVTVDRVADTVRSSGRLKGAAGAAARGGAPSLPPALDSMGGC